MPCKNGGVCVNGPGVYTCNCPLEWAGVNCEVKSCYSYCFNEGSCVQNQQGFVLKF